MKIGVWYCPMLDILGSLEGPASEGIGLDMRVHDYIVVGVDEFILENTWVFIGHL